MLKISELLEELKKFPVDADCYGYEGEVSGIIISKDGQEIGYIKTGDVNYVKNF